MAGIAWISGERALRSLAGARSFERGDEYFTGGSVVSLVEHQGVATAKVQGSRKYRVKLWGKADEPEYECSCPVGLDGAFCKHCVAVGLAVLAGRASPKKAGTRAGKARTTMDDVRAHLLAKTKEELAELLMSQALEDDRLRQSLFLEVAKASAGGPDLQTLRDTLDAAIVPSEYLGYEEVYGYVRSAEAAVDSVAELLKEGHAAAVVELTEHALRLAEGALERVDDSDGHLGGLIERLQSLHLEACRKARPDPVALAQRLFEWELGSGYSIFHAAVETYSVVLGPAGLEAYRKLAETAWSKLPTKDSGRSESERYGAGYRLTRIMESLARQSGDVEALVAVKQRDLSSAWGYLSIAEAYREAKKPDLSLEWAERGVKAFPKDTDWRLREFLADEYHRLGRYEEAMALVWAEFLEGPSLVTYEHLAKHARKTRTWPSWRAKALEEIRQQITGARAAKGRLRWSPSAGDHSLLVEVLLWEKDVEAAWKEAQQGGCTPALWMELAAKRETSHPEDCIPIYLKRLGPTIEGRSNEWYRTAVQLLRKIRGLLVRTKRVREFDGILEGVRREHRAKRNLMALLDRAKWG